MMNTVTRPQNESMAMRMARDSGITSPLGNFFRCAMIRHEDHQRQTEQQPGNDAGHEQMRDRNGAAGGKRIDHRVM